MRLARAGADYISLSAGGKFEDARHIPGEPLYPYTGYSGDRCMPGSNYPDGANLYIPEAVRACVRAAGLQTPIVAAGKIGTLELSPRESSSAGRGTSSGWRARSSRIRTCPRSGSGGRRRAVVRCVYGNVCKALDENFRRVDCTLWPKRLGQAPESDDTVAPTWPASGAELTVEYKDGRVLLRWKAATDNEQMYGYQIFRAEAGGPLVHFASTRAASARFEDPRVIGGETYSYAVRPYDLAGNRGEMTAAGSVVVPEEHIAPADPVHLQVAKDPGAVEGCAVVTGG